MKLNTTLQYLQSNSSAERLYNYLNEDSAETGLEDSYFYFDFPVYRGYDGELVVCEVMLISKNHGIVVFAIADRMDVAAKVKIDAISERLDHVISHIFSRLIQNKSVKKSATELIIKLTAAVFSPGVGSSRIENDILISVINSQRKLSAFLATLRHEPLNPTVLAEVVATIEGANGIIKQKARSLEGQPKNSKGRQVAKLEMEIACFDERQLQGYTQLLKGPQRLRGLAGSGKTIVLAMKAAMTHIKEPDAIIIYTFYTKSLYQYIKRLITRFYRQFNDVDPNWENVRVMHAWGGHNKPGLYYDACTLHDQQSMNYKTASSYAPSQPFEYACKTLLETSTIHEHFDYVIIDEAQDFPPSFIELCAYLTKEMKFIYAYDELQTIFQKEVLSLEQIFKNSRQLNTSVELVDDIVLYKCYRNPREILVCAHALGFGIYGSRIVQMLENREHWVDIGYDVLEGDFTAGSTTVISRPPENSLPTISELNNIEEIIKSTSYEEFNDEVISVANSIKKDMDDGLLAEDILVIVVDDRNAKSYLRSISNQLNDLGIETNNTHDDYFGLRDFTEEGAVTLSTVYKAKGNEAYMVYVVGADAIYDLPDVIDRNKLFSAITRAKAWVRISGQNGDSAPWTLEIKNAIEKYPELVFRYPTDAEIKVMRRDLAKVAISKHEAARKLDEILDLFTPDEIIEYINKKVPKPTKSMKPKRKK